MYQSLIATSKTLLDLVDSAIRTDPILFAPTSPFKVRGMSVRLQTPFEMKDQNHEGVSIWLYRIIRDDERLNDPPTRPTPTTIKPPPLPLRLHYLMTPITSRDNDGDPETEQYLMGKILQLFYSHPVVRGVDLKDELAGSDAELHVRLESLSIDELARIWDALEGSYQLSVSYEVAVVNIDSALEPDAVAPVTTVLPEYSVIV
jgi:Pvc16 N-terminal domain